MARASKVSANTTESARREAPRRGKAREPENEEVRWYHGATCQGYPADWWDTTRGTKTEQAQAKEICNGKCGVREQCLEYAVKFGAVNGIWGGTTPAERGTNRNKGGGA